MGDKEQTSSSAARRGAHGRPAEPVRVGAEAVGPSPPPPTRQFSLDVRRAEHRALFKGTRSPSGEAIGVHNVCSQQSAHLPNRTKSIRLKSPGDVPLNMERVALQIKRCIQSFSLGTAGTP
ncbi:unnamed protein product [Boreogadus saida]